MTREKQLTTGKAVFDVEFVLLHQQREMNSLKTRMDAQAEKMDIQGEKMDSLQTRMDLQGDKMDKVISMLERLADKVALPVNRGDVIAMTASGWCW